MNPWTEGIIRSPDGPMRQVPQRHVFNSILCITPCGVARRRFWNSGAQTWSWAEPSAYVEDGEGRFGLNVEDGFRTLEWCIASAWLLRAPDSCVRVHLQPGKPPHLKWLQWPESEDAREMIIHGETFKPVRWKVGAINVSTDQFELSNKGRLMHVASGAITSGLYFADSRWAAVHGLLVDLLLASRLRQPIIDLPPRIMMAAECLWAGDTPSDLAYEAGVGIETAWSYCFKASQHVSRSQLRALGPKLVSSDLWSALKSLRNACDSVLDTDLTTLKVLLDEELEGGEYEKCEAPFAEIRFARLCLSE